MKDILFIVSIPKEKVNVYLRFLSKKHLLVDEVKFKYLSSSQMQTPNELLVIRMGKEMFRSTVLKPPKSHKNQLYYALHHCILRR